MLFNSLEFVLLFLPCMVGLYYALWAFPKGALRALTLGSLFFYSYWNPAYLPLILGSTLFNFFMGKLLAKVPNSRVLLGVGVGANLALIGYYKYFHFFCENLGITLSIDSILLPLGISFFTFQQIAYLVDTFKTGVCEERLDRYCLFVTFFPQLIAGPIVHHSEVLSQFTKSSTYRFSMDNFVKGITIFVAGLAKKVLIADALMLHVGPIFTLAEEGVALNFLEGWGAALAYTFQLYFDFSGYSDMAIGLGLLFNIRLPQNFNSPYKAKNIIDFWRRWHMTLSKFLRDYLYIPIGGNQKGEGRRHINLMITMLLGGLWHGAGWLFVIWGALHGAYLIINHLWIKLVPGKSRWYSQALTFMAIVVAWVFFRAQTMEGALSVLKAMAGANGLISDFSLLRFASHSKWATDVAIAAVISYFSPNVYELMESRFKPHPAVGFAMGVLCFVLLRQMIGLQASEFLYFQF